MDKLEMLKLISDHQSRLAHTERFTVDEVMQLTEQFIALVEQVYSADRDLRTPSELVGNSELVGKVAWDDDMPGVRRRE